jgi:hypothetical protein
VPDDENQNQKRKQDHDSTETTAQIETGQRDIRNFYASSFFKSDGTSYRRLFEISGIRVWDIVDSANAGFYAFIWAMRDFNLSIPNNPTWNELSTGPLDHNHMFMLRKYIHTCVQPQLRDELWMCHRQNKMFGKVMMTEFFRIITATWDSRANPLTLYVDIAKMQLPKNSIYRFHKEIHYSCLARIFDVQIAVYVILILEDRNNEATAYINLEIYDGHIKSSKLVATINDLENYNGDTKWFPTIQTKKKTIEMLHLADTRDNNMRDDAFMYLQR